MLTATAGRRFAAWRQQTRRAVRSARALWGCWAIITWNVVFDHVIEVAGRNYIDAAARGPYARMDDWMRPAVARGLWTATAAGVAILVVGQVLIALASVRLPEH